MIIACDDNDRCDNNSNDNNSGDNNSNSDGDDDVDWYNDDDIALRW